MEDDKLKDLIVLNKDLIYSIIHKFRSRDYDDLFQAGCIGLIKAYKKYDNKANVKFTSYAYKYIVGEVYQHILNNRVIHLSPMNIKLINAITKATEYLINSLGRIPSDYEICSFLEIDIHKYEEIKNVMLVESIENNDYHQQIRNIEHLSKDQLIDLRNALKKLTIDEKKLIKARYFDNYTQQELAEMYNTNQVKISRDEKKILCKLKAKMY